MGESLSIRRYRPDDRERVLALQEAAMRDAGAYVEDVPEPDLEDVTASYLEAGGEFLVGEVHDAIVATGAFRPAGGYITEFLDVAEGTAELTRMRVDPARQRRGHGQRVYDELERRAVARGVSEFVLDVMPSQTAARALYEANGFEAVRRERLQPGETTFELVFYRKSLGDDD